MGLQSFPYDLQTQIPPGYIPINVPVQSYAPSISSHISQGSVHRLSNVFIPGYERSNRLELPNPASSSRQMIYLSPDLQGRISLKESINLKREEDIDRPLLLSLLPDQTL